MCEYPFESVGNLKNVLPLGLGSGMLLNESIKCIYPQISSVLYNVNEKRIFYEVNPSKLFLKCVVIYENINKIHNMFANMLKWDTTSII